MLIWDCVLDAVAHPENDVRRDRLCDLEWHRDRIDRAGGLDIYEAESGLSGHRGHQFDCRRSAGDSLVFQLGETLMGNLVLFILIKLIIIVL